MTESAADQWPGWSQSLWTGACGTALLHIERARAGVADWQTAHRWAATVARSPVTAHPDACGLHFGAPAVAYVLHTAGQPGYACALATLDAHIATLIRTRLQRAHRRIEASQRPALAEYDLIRGLTGLGAYLLHRGNHDLLRDVLTYLVRLTEPLTTADGQPLPGWWTPHAPNDRPSPNWSGGHANLGLAHGITGPLALLATTMRRGILVTGQPDAIDRIFAWLDRWRTGTGTNAWWPETISAAEHHTGTARQLGPGRPSWCYGTPGITRALQLAALATHDPRRQRQAELALAGCLFDARQLAQLTDASLCHGWAGLVHAVWRAGTDAIDPELFALPRLRWRMDQHLHRYGAPSDPGLLEGSAGVQLVRHTVAAAAPPTSGWDACLLLGG